MRLVRDCFELAALAAFVVFIQMGGHAWIG